MPSQPSFGLSECSVPALRMDVTSCPKSVTCWLGEAAVDNEVRFLMQIALSLVVGSELNWVGSGQRRSFRNTQLQGLLFHHWVQVR